MRRGAIKAFFNIVIVVLVLASAVLVGQVTGADGRGLSAAAVAITVPLLIATIYALLFHIHPMLGKSNRSFLLCDVADGRAEELQRELDQVSSWGASGDMTASEAVLFATAMAWPSQFRQRVVEEYTLERRTLRKGVVVDVEVPVRLLGDDVGNVYLPLVMARKGELLDLFESNLPDGEIRWLPQDRLQDFAAKVLHLLLLCAEGKKPGDELSSAARAAELAALGDIVRKNDGRTSDLTRFDGALAIEVLAVENKNMRVLAGLLVRQLTVSSPQVAIVSVAAPVAPAIRFEYKHTVTPEMSMGPVRGWRSILGFVRNLLGVRPMVLVLDLANAASCRAYHVHVHAPDDLYLASQEAVGMDRFVGRTGASSNFYARFQRRRGQSHAHFHVRDMPKLAANESPAVRFGYLEVPPGSILHATITAVASFCVLLLVGLVNSKYPDPGTDAPAFLLAFPALAATWLGFSAPSRNAIESNLSARFCLIMSTGLSLCGTALFMLHKSAGSQFAWPKIPGGISVLGVADLWWGAVISLALLNVLRILYLAVVRAVQYSYLMAGAVD